MILIISIAEHQNNIPIQAKKKRSRVTDLKYLVDSPRRVSLGFPMNSSKERQITPFWPRFIFVLAFPNYPSDSENYKKVFSLCTLGLADWYAENLSLVSPFLSDEVDKVRY